jgi:uncharacterized membrane protein YheB (UPF0754 family)
VLLDFNLLLVNLLAGSLVGYVTKSLAINLLFKEYPLIGGAEIIKDREQLEQAMSLLVEERLIKPATLLEEFQKDSFKTPFKQLIQHLLFESLQKNLEALSELQDIQGFEESSHNLKAFLLTKRDEILPVCVDVLLSHLQVTDLQTPEQWAHVIQQLFAQQDLVDPALIADLYRHLRAEWLQLPVEALCSEELFESLLQAVVPADLASVYPEAQREALAHLLQQLYQDFFRAADWQALNTSFQSLSLAQLLAGTDLDQGLERLITSVLTFLDSVKGQYLLLKIVMQVVQLLKHMDVPLSDFLTERLEDQAVTLIERYLPEIVEVLESWLRENKSELEAMIQSALSTHLQSENVVKQMIGNIFGQQLTARYQVVEKTLADIKVLMQQQGPGDMAAMVARFLKHTRIHVLVGYLEKYILNEKALVQLCLELLHKYLPRLKGLHLLHILEQPLQQLPILNQLKLERLAELAFQGIIDFCKTRILGQDDGGSLFKALLKPYWHVIKKMPLGLLLPENPRMFLDYAQTCLQTEGFSLQISEALRLDRIGLLADTSLGEVLTPTLKRALCHTLEPLYAQAIDQVLESLKRENIRQIYLSSLDIYSDLSQDPAFMAHLTDTLVELMVSLIRDNQMLDGKIYVAIKESFSRFSDDELKQEMDSFMGNELQPIKLLGAFLGAAVGVGMWYLSFLPGYGQFVKGNWALLSYSFSYAITEVGTNWMAIKMLFRPYRAYKIPGTPWNLPFTPGIFPKNKDALADSMVNFIDKKLLSKDNMVKILEKYHPAWKQAIRRVVALDNYAVVNQMLQRYTREHYGHLSPLLLNLGFSEIYAQRENIATDIFREIQQFQSLSLDIGPLLQAVQNWSVETHPAWLPPVVDKMLHSELNLPPLPVSSYLSAILPDILHHVLSPQALPEMRTATLNALGNPALAKQPLDRFLSSLSLTDGIDFLFGLVSQQLEKPEVQAHVVNLLKSSFSKLEIPHNSTLGSLFDGRLLRTVLQESDFLFESFAHYLLQLAQSKRSELTRLILLDIETQGVMEFMLLTFGGLRADIRKVVNVLIDQELPVYLQDKRAQLQALFETLIRERVAQIPVSELGLTEEMLNLERIFAVVQHYVFEHPTLVTLVKELLEAIAGNSLHYLSIQDMGYLLNLQSEQAVYDRIQAQAELLQVLLKQQWQSHEAQLLPQFQVFFETLGGSLTLQLNARVLQTVPLPLWVELVQKTGGLLRHSPAFNQGSQVLLQKWSAQDWRLFLEPDLFQRDIQKLIGRLTEPGTPSQLAMQTAIQTRFEPLILEFIDVLNETVAGETQEVVEEILVNSLIDSLRVNNRELMEPIDFESIVRKEIEIMEPERIESLFAFAQPIFKLLVWYGAWGGVIGLIVGIFEWLR